MSLAKPFRLMAEWRCYDSEIKDLNVKWRGRNDCVTKPATHEAPEASEVPAVFWRFGFEI
jgi:hypothetical protein